MLGGVAAEVVFAATADAAGEDFLGRGNRELKVGGGGVDFISVDVSCLVGHLNGFNNALLG